APADRFAERDFIRSHTVQGGGDFRHLRRIDLALVWTTENARNIPTHANSMRRGSSVNRLRGLEAFLDRAIDVLPRERFRRCDKDRDFICLCGQRRLESLHVRYEPRITDTEDAADAGHNIGGIAHL